MFILQGCADPENGIYKSGDERSFTVFFHDSSFVYTELKLESSEALFFVFQKQIVWKAKYKDNKGNTYESTSTTGVLENSDRLWLHPPRLGPLEYLEAFPFPEVRFPLKVGSEWESSIDVVSGFEELDGKKVMSQYEIADADSGDIWIIEAHSTIEGDDTEREAIFLFDEVKGFTRMTYREDATLFADIKQVD